MTMIIRRARPGDEAGIHESHMRSIREICIKDHGADEVSGWGYRQAGDRWEKAIQTGIVWVIEARNETPSSRQSQGPSPSPIASPNHIAPQDSDFTQCETPSSQAPEIHGHAYIRIYEKTKEMLAHIHGLYLTPEATGQGLAKQLLNLMVKEAKAKNIEQITLESTITAHGFYLKNGFRDTDSMQKLEIGGQPVSYFPMQLDLV